jgi:DNA-binding response OmpR family regulator
MAAWCGTMASTDPAGRAARRRSCPEDPELQLRTAANVVPQRDGWWVRRALRGACKSNPMPFLTVRDQIEDRVKDLELGADDYLDKPFTLSELLARVRTLLRRGKNPRAGSAADGRHGGGFAPSRHAIVAGASPLDLRQSTRP